MHVQTECRCPLPQQAHVRVVCDDEVHRADVPLATFQRDADGPRWQLVIANPDHADVTTFDDGEAVAAALDVAGARVNLRCTRRCGQSLAVRSERLFPVLDRAVDAHRRQADPDPAAWRLHVELTLRELRRLT